MKIDLSHRPVQGGRLQPVCRIVAAAGLSVACLAAVPAWAGKGDVKGAAAGSTTEGADAGLESCDETLGTVRIEENTNASWYSYYHGRTGSTVPLLRTLVQQSNCFVVVERNERAMQNLAAERNLVRGAEGRAGSNMGGGQMVAADYTMSPEILMAAKGTSGAKGLLGAIGGFAGTALRAAGGSMSTNEAGTVLTLVDVRSGVQISAAAGHSKNTDFGVAGTFLGGGAGGAASAFTSTPEGKTIAAAFVDSYNKMVVALRNYKAQTVKGGLGRGGRLGVQGGSTEASKEIKGK